MATPKIKGDAIMKHERNLENWKLVNCAWCGKEKWKRICVLRVKPLSFCDHVCKGHYYNGEKSPRWKGGRRINDQGYVLINMPEHHRADKLGYVREHILVMEKKIGRNILMPEEVHHKNGIRSDNRPENLVLYGSGEEHFEKNHKKSLLDARLVAWDGRRNVDKQPNVTCSHCGNPFYKQPCRIVHTKHHYCSSECKVNGWSKLMQEKDRITEYWTLNKEPNIVCAHCGKHFYRKPSLNKSKCKSFCSIECRKQSNDYGLTKNG